MFKEYLAKHDKTSSDVPTLNDLLCAVFLLGKEFFTFETSEKDIDDYWYNGVKEDCGKCAYHKECPVCIMNE